MTDPTPTDRFHRHALVMAVWIPVGFVAVALLHLGLRGGGAWWIAGGFALLLAGFVGHIIINAVTGLHFTPGETALGAVGYALALLALVLGWLLNPEGIADGVFLAFGPRGAFARFDVIRDNNLRAASRLPHRGGRR